MNQNGNVMNPARVLQESLWGYMEPCPICGKSIPSAFLERHVNSCLDSHAEQRAKPKPEDTFAALGLKLDKKPDKLRKGSATLTQILLAEKRLKRKQEQLEGVVKRRLDISETQEIEKDSTQSEKVDFVIAEPKEIGTEEAKTETEELNAPQTYSQEFPALPEPDISQPTPLDAAQELQNLKRSADLPLAHRLRPSSLNEFYGQEQLVGPEGMLRNLMESSQMPSFILWGGPGVGKTSLARIVASTSGHKFVELSGADSNAKRMKEAFANAQNEKQLTGRKTILFLDEIHRFNKAVQDILLPVIERGTVVVIGATTENPSFTLTNALLSRMHTFVMNPLSQAALVKVINRGLILVNKTRKVVHGLHLIAMAKDAVDHIANVSTGDSRVAINILESVDAYLSGPRYAVAAEAEDEETGLRGKLGMIKVGLEHLKLLLATRNFHQTYDRVGENHYDTISAFHKSVRGSDADAAVFYLARMLGGGEDPLFIARRMIVIASEDIGLRDSLCLPFAVAAMEAVQFIGMPEAEIVLAHCAVRLAKAPKSTKSYRALRSAQALLNEKPEIARVPIPMHLRNAPTKLMKELGYGDNYKYNPNYKHGKVEQRYLPEEVDCKFVESEHLGTMLDDAVPVEDYERLDEEKQAYEDFKKTFKQNPPLSPTHMSYDENLDRELQLEYFEGEADTDSDDSKCSDNFEKSYDEFHEELLQRALVEHSQ